ncbi:leucine-rich repeat extensin-like protein 1 [Penaeus chinensis]|uniref:leucine-rich repeat extensin-like protein 1 n=1 Tax=Penaeus chinensis TaxID=139456 RepID=UPI001FB67D29|nr:leucine-rich repeat extensin-like protein 1 [Penaeus chinensis]
MSSPTHSRNCSPVPTHEDKSSQHTLKQTFAPHFTAESSEESNRRDNAKPPPPTCSLSSYRSVVIGSRLRWQSHPPPGSEIDGPRPRPQQLQRRPRSPRCHGGSPPPPRRGLQQKRRLYTEENLGYFLTLLCFPPTPPPRPPPRPPPARCCQHVHCHPPPPKSSAAPEARAARAKARPARTRHRRKHKQTHKCRSVAVLRRARRTDPRTRRGGRPRPHPGFLSGGSA